MTDMTPERFGKIKALFLDACDLDPEDRVVFLEEHCGSDASLRADVEAMLAEHDPVAHATPTGDDAPTPESGPTLRRGEATDQPDMPATIGPYRVVREIGRGGMGLAYLGVRDDGQFKRRVAIKVVKRGMDSEEILARFELERQVLASLNHPNIARLYEGGLTDDGRPYFVLEYVEGLPIDRYCDVNRLDIPQRLELFRGVCAAVHYAHQNLVVHRDLKPGNIIVTGEGVPKLLDFGIAKLINPELSLLVKDPTAPALRLMTPEYASPEQVRGGMISTASDVYSLGVLLYELLTGHQPYRLRSRIQAELVRVICEIEPDRPSTALSRVEEVDRVETHDTGGTELTSHTITPDSVSRTRGDRIDRLRRQLSGDLDNIILMAMRKEPQRRYTSAEQLADDIRRHVELKPVLARPDELWYRAGKFTRRHRGALATTGLFVLALVVGLVVTSRLYRDAARARDEATLAREAEATQREAAEAYFAEAIELSEFFMRELNVEIDKRGAVEGRRRMADRALVSLQSLHDPAANDARLGAMVAGMYVSLGDIQGGDRNGNLGEHENARASYEAALEIRLALELTGQGSDDLPLRLAVNHLKLSDVLRRLEQSDASGDHRQSAVERLRSLPADRRDDPSLRRLNAVLLQAEGDALRRDDDLDGALSKYHASLALRETILDESRRDDGLAINALHRAVRDVSTALGRCGEARKRLKQYDEALPDCQRALALRNELLEQEPEARRMRRDVAVAHFNLGALLDTMGRRPESVGHYATYRASSRALAAEDSSDLRARADYALATRYLGDVHRRMGETDAGCPLLEEAVRLYEALTTDQPDHAGHQRNLGIARSLRDACVS